MAREPGVDDLLDVRRALEGACDRKGVRSVGLHAEVQGLCATLREPAVICTRHRTDRVLQEPELLRERGVVRGEDEGTHDDVRVAVHVLGE